MFSLDQQVWKFKGICVPFSVFPAIEVLWIVLIFSFSVVCLRGKCLSHREMKSLRPDCCMHDAAYCMYMKLAGVVYIFF